MIPGSSDNRSPEHISRLIELIQTLRGENGCPWDRKQTPRSMSVYLVEEVHELVDAILRQNDEAICEELGDVLFLVLFVTVLRQEKGAFSLEDVIGRCHAKMVRRHPHVFAGDALDSAEDVRRQWQAIKKTETKTRPATSILDSVPNSLPALMRAWRISERAAGTGFDWNAIAGVLCKVEEEWQEFREALAAGTSAPQEPSEAAMEFGDLLFALVNVARFAKIHPETALSEAIGKFETRFRHMEAALAQSGTRMQDLSPAELDTLWEAAKNKTTT